MDIERRFEWKPFEDLKYGALFAGIIERRCGVHAIKARAETNDKSEDSFFVTVGPFDEKLGNFPTMHHHSTIYDDPVLELIGGYRISPSLAPDDLSSSLSPEDGANGVLLILQENRILIGIANIDSIGRTHQRWLDVETGEILLPLTHTDYIVTRRWRITAPVGNAAPETIFDFKAETEST